MNVAIAIVSSSALSAVISGIFALINNRKKTKIGLEKGVQFLLLGELERQADRYISIGSASKEDLKKFREIYDAYKELGGNGWADDLLKRVNFLKLEHDEDIK